MALFDPTTYATQEEVMARQQQQQPRLGYLPPDNGHPPVQVVFCVPDDQKKYLPRRMQASHSIPTVARPRVGEVVYLARDNAWAVQLVVNDFGDPRQIRIEIWIEHIRSSRQERPTGFALTQ